MCHFRANGRPIRRTFHRFENVPTSFEHSLTDEDASPMCMIEALVRSKIICDTEAVA